MSLPFYKSVHPATTLCLAQLLDSRRCAFQLGYGDAYIQHSRNKLADEFLRSDSEYQLSVDDDLIWPTGNAAFFRQQTGWENYPEPFAGFNGLDRLMSHGKTLIGGLYRGRWAKGKWMFAEGQNSQLETLLSKGPIDEIRPTKWCATGFLLIHRSVYLDIEKRFPRLARGPDGTGGNWYSSSEAIVLDYIERLQSELTNGPLTGEKAYRALEVVTAILADARGNSPLGQGEDVCLGIRAAAAGHTSFVDLGLRCGHIGTKVY